MDIDKESLKGHLDSIILSVLLSQDNYGYEMIKKIKQETNSLFEIKEGTLYVILKRLEKNEFIESYWDESLKVGAKRKYYKITKRGIKYFKQKKSEWEFLKGVLNKFYEER
ncbi:PadR family transcriptional regulator [Clostridium sp.]|uniref:PadR family transcriptional regulator n=1 Tax=Clostridium sp. TaxID=1506 RepID=UPI0025BB730E|nr:PadR family transcriptional regulator [Clostridium sp.]